MTALINGSEPRPAAKLLGHDMVPDDFGDVLAHEWRVREVAVHNISRSSHSVDVPPETAYTVEFLFGEPDDARAFYWEVTENAHLAGRVASARFDYPVDVRHHRDCGTVVHGTPTVACEFVGEATISSGSPFPLIHDVQGFAEVLVADRLTAAVDDVDGDHATEVIESEAFEEAVAELEAASDADTTDDAAVSCPACGSTALDAFSTGDYVCRECNKNWEPAD